MHYFFLFFIDVICYPYADISINQGLKIAECKKKTGFMRACLKGIPGKSGNQMSSQTSE